MSRMKTLLTAFSESIRRLEAWIGDRNGSRVMPESVAVGIQIAYQQLQEGEIPQELQQLAISAGKLYSELKAYSEHKAKSAMPNGAPTNKFWAAAREVAEKLERAKPVPMEELESVAELRRQNVSPEQIARQIYGRAGFGPFLLENGGVNYAAIEKETKEPGSVIPQDWVPPWLIEATKKHAEGIKNRLKDFDTLADPRRTEDPHTVEEMILEGAYVQQIERTKGITRDEILELAKKMDYPVQDQPGFHIAKTYQVPESSLEPSEQGQENGSGLQAPTPESLNGRAPEMTPEQQVIAKQATIDMWEADRQLGFAEIAAALRAKGMPVNTSRCAAWITHHKKALAPA